MFIAVKYVKIKILSDPFFKMTRLSIVAFGIISMLSTAFGANDPAADWTFTNKWWAYKSGSYYYATNALKWRIWLNDKTAYNNIKNGIFQFRNAPTSSPFSLLNIGEGGVLDMRNIIVNDQYPITNLILGQNGFRSSGAGFDKYLANNCGTIKASLFYSSQVKEVYIEGAATTIPVDKVEELIVVF